MGIGFRFGNLNYETSFSGRTMENPAEAVAIAGHSMLVSALTWRAMQQLVSHLCCRGETVLSDMSIFHGMPAQMSSTLRTRCESGQTESPPSLWVIQIPMFPTIRVRSARSVAIRGCRYRVGFRFLSEQSGIGWRRKRLPPQLRRGSITQNRDHLAEARCAESWPTKSNTTLWASHSYFHPDPS